MWEQQWTLLKLDKNFDFNDNVEYFLKKRERKDSFFSFLI